MRRLCAETSRSYLGRSVGRGDVELNRKSRMGGTGTSRPGRCGELPAASERTGNERRSDIARREGIPVVTGQKSAEAILVADTGRRAEHEQTRRSRDRLERDDEPDRGSRGSASGHAASLARCPAGNPLGGQPDGSSTVAGQPAPGMASREVQSRRTGYRRPAHEDFPAYAREQWPTIRQSLSEGRYQPQPVRRVTIPKPEAANARWASRP